MNSTAMMVLAMVEAWGPALAEFFVSQLNEGEITDQQFQRILDRASASDRKFRDYVERVKRDMADPNASGDGGE